MPKKQVILVFVLGVVAILASVSVYRVFSEKNSSSAPLKMMPPLMEPGSDLNATSSATAPIPSSIDDVVNDIQSETALDTQALDSEQSAASAQVESGNQTVNDLGQSYDENQ